MGGKEGIIKAKSLLDGTAAAADLSSDSITSLDGILRDVGVYSTGFPDEHQAKDSLSHLTRGFIVEVRHIRPGEITCLLLVKPALLNAFGGMHGGAVGALAEKVAIACARTLVGEEKDLFLGELSMSYLSSAPLNAEVIIHGTVVRSGRNLTVVALEFKLKDSDKVAYLSRATLYHSPAASL